MPAARPDRGRRRFLARLAGGAALGLAGRTRRAGAEELPKVSRAEVAYQDQPRNGMACGLCSLFVAPDRCKILDGTVSRTGWCKLFDMVD
jgi:hypothetical protein